MLPAVVCDETRESKSSCITELYYMYAIQFLK